MRLLVMVSCRAATRGFLVGLLFALTVLMFGMGETRLSGSSMRPARFGRACHLGVSLILVVFHLLLPIMSYELW